MHMGWYGFPKWWVSLQLEPPSEVELQVFIRKEGLLGPYYSKENWGVGVDDCLISVTNSYFELG